MAVNRAMVSSARNGTGRDDWGTPWEVFNEYDREFHFTLDACACADNAKCDKYFTKQEDALSKTWSGVVWMNPPYSEVSYWMQKAYTESLHGATVVCLVASRTDTKWWWDWAQRGEIRFRRGRIRFEGAPTGAMFPSAIVIFRGDR